MVIHDKVKLPAVVTICPTFVFSQTKLKTHAVYVQLHRWRATSPGACRFGDGRLLRTKHTIYWCGPCCQRHAAADRWKRTRSNRRQWRGPNMKSWVSIVCHRCRQQEEERHPEKKPTFTHLPLTVAAAHLNAFVARWVGSQQIV